MEILFPWAERERGKGKKDEKKALSGEIKLDFKFTGSSFCSGDNELSSCWQLYCCRNKYRLKALLETMTFILKLPQFTFNPFINSFIYAAQVQTSHLSFHRIH